MCVCVFAKKKKLKFSDNDKYISKLNDDTWYIRGHVRGYFAHPYDLHSFPFDQHVLKITFALSVDDTIAKFSSQNGAINVRAMPFKLDSMGGTDWDVGEPKTSMTQDSAIMGGSASGKRYTHVNVSIPIYRRWSHHVVETILPLMLIEIVGFAPYFCEMDSELMVKRLGVIGMLLLTLFSFRFTVAKSLPPVPYL